MAVSVDYVVRETASNLWRNRLMTIAAVLTVAVSLSLVGAALLLRQGSANATGTLERGSKVTVWMVPTASKQQIDAVRTELSQLNYVAQPCDYWNKAQQLHRGSPPPVLRRLRRPPRSPRCRPPSGAPRLRWPTPPRWSAPSRGGRRLPRDRAAQTIKNEETFINISKWVCLSVAVILITSAAVLILNTIRMAIFARRREVSVMKLVGATNWFIRVPFMSEGLLQGLIGSLLAALVVWGVALFINGAGGGHNDNLLTAMHMSTGEIVVTNVVVVVVGMAIGSLGSAIAIRRFLDV